jgi:hypothetical protein
MYDLFKDYVPALSHTKENLLDSEDELWEKSYQPYLINKTFSYYMDTIMYANEMNRYAVTDNKLQFDYLLNSIRPRKRFSPWAKKEINSDIDLIKEYYGYSNRKAEEAMAILSSSQLEYIRSKLYKGG